MSRTPAAALAAPPVRARAAALAALTACLTATAVVGASATPLVPASAAPAPMRVVVSAAVGGLEGVAAAGEAVLAAGGRVLDRLPLVGGVAAELPAGTVLAPGLRVAPDREVVVASAGTADGPAAPLRATLGLGAPGSEGSGVTVAVVDTGVAAGPDLAGRLTSVDVTGTGPGDGYGHGTFVAGLVAGSGAASGGAYAGVAPGAHVLSVRVADAEGTTDLLTVLRGLEVARARGADVVALALSSYSPLPWQVDPLTLALGSLWDAGTVVVVPAGNDGPEATTITSPGVHPDLLTVGAVDEAGTGERADDTVPAFSARGPAPQDVAKPELVAPGRSVVSLRAPGSAIDRAHGAQAAVGEHYFRGSGTSFSTAVAAGAAAVLLAERRMSPYQLKSLLMRTAYDAPGLSEVTAAGAGGLDLRAARTAPVPADAAPTAPGRKGAAPGQSGRTLAPGTPGDWQPLVRALLRGDAEAAASSWSRLSPEARAWVASSWSALPADLRAELVAQWEGRSWGGLTPEQWAQVDWAGRSWAASSWSGRSWGASSWSGRSWGGRSWGASSWSGAVDPETGDWLDGWDAPGWTGRSWAGRSRAGRSWAGRSWAASSWSGRSWAGRSWAASSWAASSWAAAEWGT